MKSLILAFATLTLSLSVHAGDLKSTFKSLDKSRKGPFSLNYLQHSQGRVVVNQGNAAGEFQFQAAFRNEIGHEMAEKYDFYVANLFTTNYYELQGEYVYNDIYGSHAIDHAALVAVGAKAMPKAASMVRHWVIEKTYVNQYPDSAIARGFKLRGISGSEFEQAYAVHFLNFYLSSMTEDFQFLPAYLLAKGSPISDSSSLEKARNLVATLFDSFVQRFGEQDEGVRALYDLRNVIHNQLSDTVPAQIDAFLKRYQVDGQDEAVLRQIQDLVRGYYSVSAKRVSELAKKAGASAVQAAADEIVKNGSSVDRDLALSAAVADLRTAIMDNAAVPTAKKADTIVALLTASQFLNKEMTSLASVTSKNAIKVVVNVIYAEGFLIKDNWAYFQGEIDGAADVTAAGAQLADIIGIANDTLTTAFKPALDQWLSIEPKMQYFVDNTIKSSALNTAAIVAKKIKK